MIQNVPIDKISVGDNPRTFFDDTRQKELVSSIKAVGLIVPLTVGAALEDGSYPLIAGERRLRAMTELGLDEVPIYISTGDHAAGQRVIENVVRADLHPIEEGRAYLALMTDGPKMLSATALGKQLGISKTRIAGRVKLAVLPTAIADILIAGSALNAIMDELVQFTEAFGADVTERFVESFLEQLTDLVSANGESEERVNDLHDLFGLFLQAAPDIDIVHLSGTAPVEDAAPSQEAFDALVSALKDISAYATIRLTQEDFDAMRAYGALREFKLNDWQDEQYCTSKSWLWDRINMVLERQQAAAKETGAGVATNGRGEAVGLKPTDPVKAAKAAGREATPEEEAASAKLKAEAKAERDAAKAVREEAGRRNQALALGAAKAFDKHKLRLTDAKLLARIIVTGNGLVAGWELVQDKVLEGSDAGLKARELRDWICRGKSTDEVLGRLFQVIVCGTYGDNGALPPSKRRSLAYDLWNDQPEFLALARLAMPEETYRVYAEQAAARAKERELSDRKQEWRNERISKGVMYDDVQGLAPSHTHVFDPTSEAPVYIQDLNFTTVPDDVFEMVALNVAPTGQVLEMPDGWTYDGAGSVRELTGDGELKPFRPWSGEPFDRRIPRTEPVNGTVAEAAAVDPEDGGTDTEEDLVNQELDRQQAGEFADAVYEED